MSFKWPRKARASAPFAFGGQVDGRSAWRAVVRRRWPRAARSNSPDVGAAPFERRSYGWPMAFRWMAKYQQRHLMAPPEALGARAALAHAPRAGAAHAVVWRR